MNILIERALELGASEATIIPVKLISVEDEIVELCRPPQCDGYDMCANCPPHVMSPAEFGVLLEDYDSALMFKVEAPMEILLSDERDHIVRLVQETAARLERFAVEQGRQGSRALAGAAASACSAVLSSGAMCSRAVNAATPTRPGCPCPGWVSTSTG